MAFVYQCKYCKYVLPKFRRLKDGRYKDNYNRLVDHIIGCHIEEYSLLIDWLDFSCPSPTSTYDVVDILSESIKY